MSAITIMPDEEFQNAEQPSVRGFGCVETSRGNLPLKALAVRAMITGLLHETTMRQTYVNGHDEPLEATYVFPLPDRAAVGDFRMIVGERTIEGVLKERGEARREYQQAVEAGHRASIVEEERPDTFTMRVGNVAPGEEITIEFKLTGPLSFADGEATFRFPLVVASRFVPGTPLSGGNVGDGTASDTDAVPDASRISPPVLLDGFPNPIELSITVDIAKDVLGATNIRSSLHTITTSRGEEGRQRIEVRPGERVNRDFILRFDVARPQVQSTMSFVRDDEGEEGTFMVTVVPPSGARDAELPRDIVFVLDRSGSMDGWKIVAARRALGRMLDTLTPEDRFQVFVFDNALTKFGDELSPATDRNRYRAIEKLGRVEAQGGTEMAQPIFEALDMVSGGYGDRKRMIVLVTDGQVGNEEQIVKGVASRQKNVGIFTVGIDRAVNAGFLNRLADLGGGRCELVESESRLDEAMDRIHRTIDTPVLCGLQLELDGVECLSAELVPSRPVDLFAGAPVLVMGRFRGAGHPVARLLAHRRDEGSWEVRARGIETADTALTAVWARRRVRAMEDEFITRRSGADAITAVSLRFGVLCRFTSWVAIDREAKVEVGGELRQVVQPVESPEAWGMANHPMMHAFASAPQQQGFAGPMGASAMAPPAPRAARSRSETLPTGFGGSPIPESTAGFEATPQKGASSLTTARAGAMRISRYASPEEARGESTDARSDVFVLAAIAFELLTGKPLFDQRAPLDILQAIVGWDRAGLREGTAIPESWVDVLHRALAPRPEERHADARELLDDLVLRHGRGALFAPVSFPAPWTGERDLVSLLATRWTSETALAVVAWLTADVACFQEYGHPREAIDPASVVVAPDGYSRLVRSVSGPSRAALRRWLDGHEKPTTPRERFWR